MRSSASADSGGSSGPAAGRMTPSTPWRVSTSTIWVSVPMSLPEVRHDRARRRHRRLSRAAPDRPGAARSGRFRPGRRRRSACSSRSRAAAPRGWPRSRPQRRAVRAGRGFPAPTPGCRLMTRDTVTTDTPARLAMSWIVSFRSPDSPRVTFPSTTRSARSSCRNVTGLRNRLRIASDYWNCQYEPERHGARRAARHGRLACSVRVGKVEAGLRTSASH